MDAYAAILEAVRSHTHAQDSAHPTPAAVNTLGTHTHARHILRARGPQRLLPARIRAPWTEVPPLHTRASALHTRASGKADHAANRDLALPRLHHEQRSSGRNHGECNNMPELLVSAWCVLARG